MDISELRLGNYIIYEATTHILTSISNAGLCTSKWWRDDEIETEYYHNVSEAAPIPLTKEWLDRAKLQLVKGDCYYITSYFSVDIEGHLYYSNDYTGINVTTVHNLQNLYYALTGEELTFKTV